jgi:hypothetical protein
MTAEPRYTITNVAGRYYVVSSDRTQRARPFDTPGMAALFVTMMERVEADIVRGAALQTAARRPWTIREGAR